jgi:hypothetical protein
VYITATIALDTYKIISRLQQKGFTKEQAEALVSAAEEIDLSAFATKEDIKDLRSYLDQALANQTISMMKWMTGMLLAQGALIVTLIQYLK